MIWEKIKQHPIFTAIIIATVGFLVSILIVIGGCLWFFSDYLKVFTTTAHISKTELYSTISQASKRTYPPDDQRYVTWLILGTDELENRQGDTPLTDSIILVSLDTQTGLIRLLPLPRDLWSETYKTKINALYFYGFQKTPDHPTQFVQEALENMTGIPINEVFVIKLEDIAAIVTTLNGIHVAVPTGFTDELFPRSDVDIRTEHDPKKLYETVSFSPGVQTMDAKAVMAYIRSRYGDNDQNTDGARSARQQLIINSLLKELMQIRTIANPVIMGNLYRLYLDTYSSILPTEKFISLLVKLASQDIRPILLTQTIPIAPDDPNGIIVHPPTSQYQGQWVYAITEQTIFQNTIKHFLIPESI